MRSEEDEVEIGRAVAEDSPQRRGGAEKNGARDRVIW
jgi:hypothetical protein